MLLGKRREWATQEEDRREYSFRKGLEVDFIQRLEATDCYKRLTSSQEAKPQDYEKLVKK